MLDYKLLEALSMVIKEGGFDRAASKLHLTQSAVSQRVKSLEEQTGQILLVRTSPPHPTLAGKRLLNHFSQVQHLEENLFEDLDEQLSPGQRSIGVAINADSLATWFLPAVEQTMQGENLLLDLRVDDQEQTHTMLRDGEVVACITTRETPFQGCRCTYLGKMTYQMMAAPRFATSWFPCGLTKSALSRAPAVIFNRRDELHQKLLTQILGSAPPIIPASYIPSSERFASFIAAGLGYGMLPIQQSKSLVDSGALVDLVPGHSIGVKLFWHCWNLESEILTTLTHVLKEQANRLLT